MVDFGPLAAIIRVMKCAARTTVLAVTSLFLGAGAEAVTPDAPTQYQGIVERNVFNIHPPQAALNPADMKQKEAPPKITLNGISTILGRKQCILTVPSKPGAQPESLILSEEQGQDDIEVRQIDEKAQVVKIVNHGEEQTLDFDHNGTKPAGPEPSRATPMNFPPPIPAPPPAGVQPPNPIRPLRTLPMRPMGGPSTSQNQDLSPDDLEALTEAQRYKAMQENDPIAGILPPTSHTEEVQALMNGQEAPQ